MSKPTCAFLQRADLSLPLAPPPGLTFSPTSYTKTANGGCYAATVHVDAATQNDLIWLDNLLRCGIEIGTNQRRWWGYVNSVAIRTRSLAHQVSLDWMRNKVAALYTGSTPELGILAALTPWQDDLTSQAIYGIRELIAPITNVNTAAAIQHAKTLLARHKLPTRLIALAQGYEDLPQGGQSALSATITCKGWWDTLSWRYYAHDVDAISYIAEGITTCFFGNTTATQRIAQSIIVASSVPWQLATIKLHLCKLRIGEASPPTDNLIVEFCANNAGAPGTVLATATLAASAISAVGSWAEFTLDTQVSLVVGTTYWISIRRSGSVSATQFYSISVTQQPTATGVFRFYNGAAWTVPYPDCDMFYQMFGEQPIESQIANTVAACAPLIAGTDYGITSGISCPAYRDQTTNAQASIESMMRIGESTNNKRLLAEVTHQRRVQLTIQPAQGDADYQLHSNGQLESPSGRLVPPDECLVGIWVRPAQFFPFLGDSDISTPSYFVESATYITTWDRWLPTFGDPLAIARKIEFAETVTSSWEITRQIVLARDRYRCTTCGRTAEQTGWPLEIHHIVPQSCGGGNDPMNLTTLCHPCHAKTATYGVDFAETGWL